VSTDGVINAFGALWSLETAALSVGERERLHVLWERCRVPGARAGDAGVEPFVVRGGDPYAVSRAITLASLRRRRGSTLLLHAAGLSRGGRALALVGRSGAGKSTASQVLGQHLGYLSDETVAVEGDGRVSPYPKPVSVITDPGAPWVKAEWSPDELGLRKASEPAYLVGVVVLERDPVHAVPQLAELPLIDAMLAVIAQSSSLTMLDRPLHRLAEVLSLSGGPYALRYNEIGDCVDLLGDILDGRTVGARPPWTSIPPPVPISPIPPKGPDTPVVRAPWRDAVEGEGGTLVLVGETPVLLGPVGEAIWHRAHEPISVAQAHDAVVSRLGAHPRAEAAIAAGIAAMRESGVLLPRP
jgi:hypothetical protein